MKTTKKMPKSVQKQGKAQSKGISTPSASTSAVDALVSAFGNIPIDGRKHYARLLRTTRRMLDEATMETALSVIKELFKNKVYNYQIDFLCSTVFASSCICANSA